MRKTQSGEDAPLLEMIYSGNPFAFPTGLGLSLGHSPIQDGVSFGTGESQVGDLIVSDDPGEPIDRVVSEAVMRRYLIWNGLDVMLPARSTIPVDSMAGNGGRSLRTPSFDITAGKLYIYLRGGCRTYVEVDSHTINNGPLHGSLMKEHPLPEDDPQGSRWRWVEHDVTRYQGHRALTDRAARHGTSGDYADCSKRPRCEFWTALTTRLDGGNRCGLCPPTLPTNRLSNRRPTPSCILLRR